MSKEFTYIDEGHLESYLANLPKGDLVYDDPAHRMMRDLMLTLEKDRVEATDYAKAAANHIEELIEAARQHAQRIDRLETTLVSAGKVADEIAKERDALREQIAALSLTAPLQLIFRVEGDVYVTSPPASVVVESNPDADGG